MIPYSSSLDNPQRARGGSGVYFTDIVPGSLTKGQIARRLYGSPHLGNQAHVEAWVAVDVSDFYVIPHPEQEGSYLVPWVGDLPVEGKIVDYGNTP